MDEIADMNQARRRNGPVPNDPNSQISTKLRQYYDSVQEEAIPERFLELLEKLDAVEDAAKSQLDKKPGKAGKNGRN